MTADMRVEIISLGPTRSDSYVMSPWQAEFAKYGIIYNRFVYCGNFLCTYLHISSDWLITKRQLSRVMYRLM